MGSLFVCVCMFMCCVFVVRVVCVLVSEECRGRWRGILIIDDAVVGDHDDVDDVVMVMMMFLLMMI